MQIKNHWLYGAEISHVNTPNKGGKFGENLPDTIIVHYTAGSSLESAVNTLTNPKIKASAHLVIGRDGKICQLAPFNSITWHAGQSQYGGRTGFNQYSIGIELDNAGLLEKRGDGYYSWFGRKYSEENVVKAVHRNETIERYWHAYTEVQLQLVYEISLLLNEKYNIQYVLGHEEVSPGRKIDPGPAFPLDKMRDKILNLNRNQNEAEDIAVPKEGIVTASRLNIRSSPDVEAEQVALPLPKGTKVQILEAKDG
ncbi:MAG: N-acetylmuramoyl-L-alanine amidase [Cytophagaceae bacterium]